MKKHPNKKELFLRVSTNNNKKSNKNYVPFKREFEQNFLKLFGIIL